MKYENDPDGTRLPVKLDTTTNGEFAPIPLARVHHHANRLALREKHGYPRMTPALRAKVFGLNALRVYSIPDDVLKKHRRDRVALRRGEYRERPDPTFLTHGPRTRREFLNLKAWG